MTLPPDLLRAVARRLASELHFQPASIDALSVDEAVWWLGD